MVGEVGVGEGVDGEVVRACGVEGGEGALARAIRARGEGEKRVVEVEWGPGGKRSGKEMGYRSGGHGRPVRLTLCNAGPVCFSPSPSSPGRG